MKIGIIKETKTPQNSLVAISPQSAEKILWERSEDKKERRKDISIAMEKSDSRCFAPTMYDYLGVEVNKEDMSDCDVLFGVKEENIDALIPNKHYFFFGHVAKMQEYNKPLLQAMIDKKITFTDYEYLTDEKGKRVCYFGNYAGIVGAYNTLRLWAIRQGLKDVGSMHGIYSVDKLLSLTRTMKAKKIKILVTGDGNVSLGVQCVLRFLKMEEVPLSSDNLDKGFCFSIARTQDLVERIDGAPYDRDDFHAHPEDYRSEFDKFAEEYDVLIAAHRWEKGQPVYFREECVRNANNKIKVVGDITCDISGSIRTTIKPSTLKQPFYSVKLLKDKFVKCADNTKDAIAVMAVDNLPNALPIDASVGFSTQLEDVILNHLLVNGVEDETIKRATIVKNGKITDRFAYLNDYLKA